METGGRAVGGAVAAPGAVTRADGEKRNAAEQAFGEGGGDRRVLGAQATRDPERQPRVVLRPSLPITTVGAASLAEGVPVAKARRDLLTSATWPLAPAATHGAACSASAGGATTDAGGAGGGASASSVASASAGVDGCIRKFRGVATREAAPLGAPDDGTENGGSSSMSPVSNRRAETGGVAARGLLTGLS